MRLRLGVAAFGAAMAAGGLAILVGAAHIPAGFGYDAVGPDAFPRLIGGGFLVSAVLILLEARRGLVPEDDGPAAVLPVATISGALLLSALLVERLGWVPMSALTFMAGATALGDRRYLKSGLLGLLFGLLTFVVFNWGLGLNLPAGVLAPALGFLR